MRCLIVGYGSIGGRHVRLLRAMGHEAAAVTKRVDAALPVFSSIAAACAETDYDLVIIASPTVRHADDYAEVARYSNARLILLEKPAFSASAQRPRSLTAGIAARTRIAYNLRFHPAMAMARELISGNRLYSAVFYVGQYLPDWRPGTDYRSGYSADPAQGGGALRDLSHELDLACHLTGPWRELTASGGKHSHLEIASDDLFSILSSHESCPHVVIHVNYLDRALRRHFVINHEGGTVSFDFSTGILASNGATHMIACKPDQTYANQLRDLLHNGGALCASFEQGLDVLAMIEAAEQAASQKRWVSK